jgi:uncharacterized membrane protein YeaQ/YmgE (transglycosylase-associated protein family)
VFDFIGWCIFGLIVGMLARLFVPGPDPLGCFGTIGLGILGSIVGGFVWNVLLGARAGYQPGGWFMSIVGAILVLVVYQKLLRPPRPRM